MAVVVLTDQSFEPEVLKSSVPVLVDFWAPWCGPCRIQGPIIEELASETDVSKFKITKLNVDENLTTAQRYNILSIPSLLIFKNGQVVQQFVGVQSKDNLKSALAKLI
ncbi:MAG: thioredoxin [Patescibacteria group bacterium]